MALVAGAVIALTCGNPAQALTHRWTHRLLPLAVVGLGAEMNLGTVARVGLHGLGYTAVSLTFVMAAGLLLGRFLKVDRDAGPADQRGHRHLRRQRHRGRGPGAAGPAPPGFRGAGHGLPAERRGAGAVPAHRPLRPAWARTRSGCGAALAIHDTSSVVGAGLAYGPRALAVATTVKLARALWIVPLTLAPRLRGGQTGRAGGGRGVRARPGR